MVGLANLAGISSPTPFLDETREAWDRVLAVNMTGTFLVTQRVLRGMVQRRLGRVVSVSSISAQRGGGTYSKVAYSATKAGIIGFTRALAREMGGARHHRQLRRPGCRRHRHHGRDAVGGPQGGDVCGHPRRSRRPGRRGGRPDGVPHGRGRRLHHRRHL